MIQEYFLANGPSRESLFDCLRLGLTADHLKVVEFLGRMRGETITTLHVEIEGLHRAGKNGLEWFFWGRLKKLSSADTKHIWETRIAGFAFGQWNILQRQGAVKIQDDSFFERPISKDEMENIITNNR